jgi:hypothetical protein
MLNHNTYPNCVAISIEGKDTKYTEVWTTRHVKTGEELFINYVYPHILLHATLSAIILNQHRFTPRLPPPHFEAFVPDALDKLKCQKFSLDTEKLLNQLEVHCQILHRDILRSQGKMDIKEITSRAESIFQEGYDAYIEFDKYLSETHIIRRRMYSLLAKAAEFGDAGHGVYNWGGETSVALSCAATCAALRFHLKELIYIDSISEIGPFHRDAASACNAVSCALQRLLAKSSRMAVKKAFPERLDWQSGINAIPIFETSIRKRAEALRNLYDSRLYFE